MRRVIKKHLRDFIAVAVIFGLAVVSGSIIVVSQGGSLPGWVPLLGENVYQIKAKFQTAQAVVPGQGQAVKIAGVDVGEISGVELEDGQAVVTMKIDNEYSVYKDATMLLSPGTLLKDENIDLNPGTKEAGRLTTGSTLSQANTHPDVNLDEVLSVLDADTREYLQLLLASTGKGFGKNGDNLRATLGEFKVTTIYLDRINSKIAERRKNLKSLIHNFQLLITEVGNKDDELAQLVDSVNANFQALAEASPALRETVKLLPGTLKSTTTALKKTDKVARLLGPTLDELRPGARKLSSTLKELRPFFKETEPVVRKQLRPFAKEAAEPVSNLRPVAARLADIVPDVNEALGSFNYLFNELAYNNGTDSPFLFWAAWTAHNLASTVSVQDANGVKLRGLILMSCLDMQTISNLSDNPNFPQVRLLAMSLGMPDKSKVCG